jgi:microcompartment protein CcmK/EutM
VLQIAASRPVELTAEKQVDEAVFQQAFIARKLEEVEHFERDAQRLREGENRDIYFTTLTGMAADGSGAGSQPKVLLASQSTCTVSAKEATSAVDCVDMSDPDKVCVQELNETTACQSAGIQHAGEIAVDGHGHNCALHEATVPLGGTRVHGSDVCCGESDVDSQASDLTDTADAEWTERAKLSPEEVRDARKANKQAVKSEQREKRLNKIPKKVKKRAEKKGKVKK